MSTVKAPSTSRSVPSKSDSQGVYRADPMYQMHQKSPTTTQSPSKTIAQLKTILNPPDCNCAAMSPKQAAMNKEY